MTQASHQIDQSGYGSEQYVRSISQGQILHLPKCNGWLIRRSIGFDGLDATHAPTDLMGAYPIFQCANWHLLVEDMNALDGSAVSVALVTDPFADITPEELRYAFPDRCFPYKRHLVADLSREPDQFISRHHRRNIKHAMKALSFQIVAQPLPLLKPWMDLYANLIRRHAVYGMAAFSRASFADQLAVPGMTAIVARDSTGIVGVGLWLEQRDVCYYHLAAYNDRGYAVSASFGIFRTAIDYFRGRVQYIAFGAGPGLADNPSDGLTRFKAGWSTESRYVYFCGRILDQAAYVKLCAIRSQPQDGPFFPSYRSAV